MGGAALRGLLALLSPHPYSLDKYVFVLAQLRDAAGKSTDEFHSVDGVSSKITNAFRAIQQPSPALAHRAQFVLPRTLDATDLPPDVGPEQVRGNIRTVAQLADTLQVEQSDIDLVLLRLQSEGYVMQGHFTPGAQELEWCERHLLARLEHPGIARLLDGGLLADGRPFLALEFVQGERIDDWCEEKSLNLRKRIALFLKACAAVEFAHRARRLYSGREAVVDGDLRFTYAQFLERCDRWSSALQELGVRQGDRVAYIAPNTHWHLCGDASALMKMPHRMCPHARS